MMEEGTRCFPSKGKREENLSCERNKGVRKIEQHSTECTPTIGLCSLFLGRMEGKRNHGISGERTGA